MSLLSAIEEFDGRDRGGLERALETPLSSEDRGYLTFALAASPRHARAAGWSIRFLVESDRADEVDLAAAFAMFEQMSHWSAQFNVAQCVSRAPKLALGGVDFFRGLASSERTALRVIALDALTHLALVDEALLPEVKRALLEAAKIHSLRSARGRAR